MLLNQHLLQLCNTEARQERFARMVIMKTSLPMDRSMLFRCGLLLVTACAMALVHPTLAAKPRSGERTGAASALVLSQRLREGTLLTDISGYFKIEGDRISFLAEGEYRPLTCLENLGLERISKTISESTSPVLWSVSGTITEYQNSNFLLVTRAVKRSTARSQTPAATTETAELGLDL